MKGKIYIVGQIGSDEDEKGVELIDVVSQVKRQPEAKHFDVFIDTVGGFVNVGFDIYDYLLSLKSKGITIDTIGSGMVASMGTVIFMAGTNRIVRPGTQFMIHLPFGGILNATAETMKEYAQEMERVEKRCVEFYLKTTNLEKEAIYPLLKNETWLTEEQLFDLGFTTEKSELKAVAKLSTINPKTMSKDKKAKNILQLIKSYFDDDSKMKVVLTADNVELNFPDLEDDAEISVGDAILVDGENATGEYILADGRTVVAVNGVVDSIEEAGDGDDDDDEEMQALKDRIKELENEVKAKEKAVTSKDAEIASMKAKLEKAEKTIKAIEKVQSKFVAEDGKNRNRNNGNQSKATGRERFRKALENQKN